MAFRIVFKSKCTRRVQLDYIFILCDCFQVNEISQFLQKKFDRRQAKLRQKRRQMSSLLFGGQKQIKFLATLSLLHQDDAKKRMNRIIATCMIIQFTPYQTNTLPNWMFSQILLFKSYFLLNGQCSSIQVYSTTKYDPQPAATNFAFFSVIFFFYVARSHYLLFPPSCCSTDST